MKNEMTPKDVINLYRTLESLDIKIWIDGGWAVDALLGEQTRPHEDLDIAVDYRNLIKLKKYLDGLGYGELHRDEDKKWDSVLRDNSGHEIDIHSFKLDNNGNIIEEAVWNGYSRNSLDGNGVIDGVRVRCVNLEQIIKTHDKSKRVFKNSDHKDMEALSKKFGI